MNQRDLATKQDLNELKAELIATMREIETNLLRAFHSYSERVDLRLRRVETAEATTAERIASVEADARWAALELRVIELEKRLPPGPSQG